MPFTYTEKARITLERAKRSKIIRSYLDQQSYVRIQQAVDDGVPFHKKYWCPGAAGYTAEKDKAWITGGEDAWRNASHCSPEKGIVFVVLKQHDHRTQEEMPPPRLRFIEARPDGTYGMKFKWEVDQIMSQGRDGKGLNFNLLAHWTRDTAALVWEVDLGEAPGDLAQLARWHRAVAFALANLPEPRLQIPLW